MSQQGTGSSGAQRPAGGQQDNGSSRPPCTVTFLLTDLVDAVTLARTTGATFAQARTGYQELMRRAVRQHGGIPLREGEGFAVAAFGYASDALTCAVEGQQAVAQQVWPQETGPLAVRMELHTEEVGTDWPFAPAPPGSPADHIPRWLLHRALHALLIGQGGQIICSQATAVLLRDSLGTQVELVEVGDHRLDDDIMPERLFQVHYSPVATPSGLSSQGHAGAGGGLPTFADRFVGREREVAWLQEALQSGSKRLVTLTGMGGSGKTRLALQVAQQLLEPWQGAVWFVPMAELSEASWILDTVRDALHLPPVPGLEPLEQVTEVLSRQRSLLVLDTFEQLVEEGAGVVQDLLERVPTLTCLITSRQPLNLMGEQEFPVAPLPTPEESASAEEIEHNPSVQLFVERARAVNTAFQVNSGNAAAIAELCRRLEGIPLALELAAVRMESLTVEQILAQLADRFAFLVSQRQEAATRHATLWAAIDWSYQLLSPDLQRFFARLAVFRGGWSLEAAEAVWGEGSALDYLEELHDCSLVVATEEPEEVRYRYLETLRAYAWRKLEEQGEVEAAQRSHLRYLLELVEAGEAKRQQGQEDWALRRLETEQDNLRAAVAWSVVDAPTEALQLAARLGHFWSVRGYWTEGRATLDRVLEAAASATPALRAHGLRWRGHLAYRQGDYQQAEHFLTASLALGRECNDGQLVGETLTDLGRVAWGLGEYARAQAFYQEALTYCQQIGSPLGTAVALGSLGSLAYAQGDYPKARDLLEQSLALARQMGYTRGLAGWLNNLGVVAYAQAQYDKARSYQEQSLRLHQERGDRDGIATCLNDLGAVATAQGDFRVAREHFEESLSIRRQIGDKRGMALSLNNLGLVAKEQGDYQSAYASYQESLRLQTDIGDRRGMALSLNNLGDVALTQGQFEQARSFHEQALQIHQEIGHKWGTALSFTNLGETACAQGDFGAARSFFEKGLQLLDGMGDRWLTGFCLKGLGDVACGEDRLLDAYHYYQQSLALRREIGDKVGIASALEGMAQTWVKQGVGERAVELLGASDALRAAIRVPLGPGDRQTYDQMLAGLRATLGEETFASAWQRGRSLTWEQASDQALASRGTTVPSAG